MSNIYEEFDGIRGRIYEIAREVENKAEEYQDANPDDEDMNMSIEDLVIMLDRIADNSEYVLGIWEDLNNCDAGIE